MYLWIKSLHVIAIIAWMAGLLYLPRLFVYHCEAEKGSVQSETFKIMERRLLKAIMNPAMMVAWGAGLYLAWDANLWLDHWFMAKFACVCGLTFVHHMLVKDVKRFAADANERPQRYYRILNEVPTLLMIGIVIFVIVKPF